MIINPILRGFNPDPSICRRGDEYFVAVSSFEWMPGIPIYRSQDLKNWELYSHVFTDDTMIDLKKLPSAKGLWAPCLTWCEEDGRFYLVYGVMNSMNARYFDVDNFVITAPDVRGPWSAPVYLHSAGFDASMFHDENGRKYVVSLQWETRENYEHPGIISLVEYDPRRKEIVGYPQGIWRGGTDRGCIEAPHITKHAGRYYLMCAEGGTGYNHCVTMARAENISGPYVGDPENPILTSSPGYSYERDDADHLKPKYFNPNSVLQKSGHASYVDLPNGQTYLVHLCSRPFVPELRCTLGRETAIQKMQWTEDGWLRLAAGGNLARLEVPEPDLPACPLPNPPEMDDFDSAVLANFYYAPRISPARFADVQARPGFVRLRGQEALTSLNKVSILARRLTSVFARVATKMEYEPKVPHQNAGLVMYYDNMNHVCLRKYMSETLKGPALLVSHMENGTRTQYLGERIPAPKGPVWMRLIVEGRESWFEWSADGETYMPIGPHFETSRFSDEYCEYGEFTGTMAGLMCVDRIRHSLCADFDFFEYFADETRQVP